VLASSATNRHRRLPRPDSAEKDGAAGAGTGERRDGPGSDEDTVCRSGDRGLVRARLRARLVDRCSRQLVDALEEKHGSQWVQGVLQASFHVHESMIRICESFGLRPHLEAKVLREVQRRATREESAGESVGATALPLNAVDEADEVLPLLPDCDDSNTEVAAVCLVARALGGGPHSPESDVAWSPTPSTCGCSPSSSGPTTPCFSALASPAPAPTLGCASQLVDVLLLPELDVRAEPTSSSDHDDGVDRRREIGEAQRVQVDGIGEVGEVERVDEVVEVDGDNLHEGVGGRAQPQRRRSRPWMSWALWALGHRLAHGRHPLEPLGRSPEDTRKMTTDLLQRPSAAPDRSTAGMKLPVSALISTGGRHHRGRSGCEVHFAGSSEVVFFDSDETQAGLSRYQRPVQTKLFDGPSAHKARRHRCQVPLAGGRRGLLSKLGLGLVAGSRLDTACIDTENEVQGEGDEDGASEGEEEDWRDQCDEIADLMSQQRYSLLWSASW